MKTDLLLCGAGKDLLNQTSTKEDGLGALAASRIVVEPVVTQPGVCGTLQTRVRSVAGIQKEMTDHAPRGRNLELIEESQQSVHDLLALEKTGLPESVGSDEILGAPDEFEIERECESSAFHR